MLDAIAILLGGIVTYMTRVIFLVSKRVRPPKAVKRYLPLVGPAVLGAIAIPGLLAPGGDFSWTSTVPSVIAGLLAWLAWRLTHQMVAGLVVGLGAWWGMLWAISALGWG